MNVGVYLTEQQIRNLVRQELKTILFEQEEENKQDGILQTIKKTGPLVLALLAIATAAGDTSIQKSLGAESGGGQTFEDQLKSIGVNPSEVGKMTNLAGLDASDVTTLHNLLQSQLKADNDVRKIKQALATNTYSEEDTKKLQEALRQKEIASASYSRQIQKNEKLLNGFLNAGIMATNYLMNNGKVSDDLKVIQQDILKYGLEQSQGIALQTAQDDIYRFNKEYVKKDFYMGNSGISDPKDLAMSWLVTHDKEFQTYLTQHPDEEFTAIEIATALDKSVPDFEANVNNYFIPNGKTLIAANTAAKQAHDTVTGIDALNSAGDYQERMNVGEEITPEQAKQMSDEEINKLPPEARQAVRNMKAGLQEAKLNKLRQKLNELRGVYV